jgi:hypothetical protein
MPRFHRETTDGMGDASFVIRIPSDLQEDIIMTATHTKKYRTLLREMATRLGATVSGLEDQVRNGTGGEAAGGISNAPVHLADIGTL